jgi:hypothetical protein
MKERGIGVVVALLDENEFGKSECCQFCYIFEDPTVVNLSF